MGMFSIKEGGADSVNTPQAPCREMPIAATDAEKKVREEFG